MSKSHNKIILRFRAVNKDIFEMIRSGEKLVETRAATEQYRKVALGDTVERICGNKRFKKIVKKVAEFPSVGAVLKKYRVVDIMPRLHSVKELQEAYYNYPNYKEIIKKFGIVAWEFE